MQYIQKFLSGYIKTILFAIEYQPKFQFPQKLFIVPHFLHHIQIIGLLLDNSNDKVFDYIVTITHHTLIEGMLTSLLKQIYLSLIFVGQLFLFCYLIVATAKTQQVINNNKLRLILEKQIEIVNSTLHWYFTFYSVFTMPIITISFYYINGSLFIYQIFSYFIIILQYFQGIILIYLLRNHRFAENNSFKRRFAFIQVLNYSLSYGIIFFKFTVDLKLLKYMVGLSYAIIQIIDQFYSCPYRDPFREPSLKAALILLTTVIISLIFYSQDIQDQSQFYWTLFAAGLMSGLADSASAQFHEFAMSNYNSKFNLQEKYIIIGVDQFYSHFQHYQENDQTKIVYFQQLIKHRENCSRSKCPTQSLNLAKVNTNDRYQLHRMTLSVISCIFKTCHGRTVIRNGILYKPKFEQLQLQYISFLSQIAQRPLIAYVELRKYQLNQNDDNSLYFRELTSKISQELEFSILYLQERMVSQQFRKEKYLQQEDKLTIAQIWRSINFYQYITPKIIDLIDKKQKYWDLLVEGYEDLRPLQVQQITLCESINTIYKEIKSKIMIPEEFFDRSKDISITTVLKDLDPEDRNINILNLKIYSILYSVILNDFDRAFQAEKQIEDLIKEDRQKSNDIIDDGALQKDDAVVVLISLVRKKGHIVNQNLLTLANFFEFQNAQDIAGQTLISTFLPPDLRNLHDSLLNSFISKGFTKFSVQSIHSYYVQKEGYLRECYIKLGNLFQDPEDFVLTGSILKIQQSIDVIMFDSYGKLLGISQEFYENRLRKANPTLTIDRLIEQGHIFLIIPYLIINLKKLASNNELETLEYVDFAYIFQDLQELILQYSQTYQMQQRTDQQKQSTYNLTTIRSQQLSQVSNRDTSNPTQSDYQQIKGTPIALLGQERMIGIMEFLIRYASEKETMPDTLKVKYSIQYQNIETKKENFAYFILRMEQLNEYERSDTLTTQSFIRQLKRTLNTLKFGEQQSNMDSAFSMKIGNTNQQSKHSNLNEQESSQIIDQQPQASSIIIAPGIDLSAINDILIQDDKIIKEKVIFQNPVISEQGGDELDFQNLVCELDLQDEESKLKIIEQFDEPKFDSDLMEKKSNSSKQQGTKKNKNILEIFQTNKQNINLHNIQELQQQSSKPSSQRTSSSKSPYLLVRTLYQIEDRNFNMWIIIILNTIICLAGFILIFIKVFIVQDQYKILQSNLNFVQYPETINNYFLKTTMFSNNLMQQKIGLANYSDQLNNAILSELDIIQLKIEKDLKGIYEDIITFESQVIPKDDYLKIVNNLISFSYQFDLTILMEQLSSNTIFLSQEFQLEKGIDDQILSMIIFFRLNMVAQIKIARSYINYLNENLLYYEDQIVNVLTYVIVSELSIITILIMIQTRILQEMNDFLRKMLILTTKLSEEDVNLLNRNLQEIKLILKDPKQVLWKTTNYVTLIFEPKQWAKQINQVGVASSFGSVTGSKDKERKVRRKYQNSSLTSRVYNLRLPQIQNWAILFLLWLFVTGYLLGALGLAINMISQIKPALTLNLQLIEFKLKYDALVVFAEISKTDLQVQNQWKAYPIKNITFNNLEIISELVDMMDGFQDQMGVIYDQLASSQSLLDTQKTALLIPFKNSLCESMADQIPSCIQTPVDPSDDSYEYISGGVVNAVHEFSKTLHLYWDKELQGRESNITLEELKDFLNSKTHKTQFVQHFLYQGKALENIASTMLKFNRLTLESVIISFQVYMYIAGLLMISLFSVLLYYWVQKIEIKLYLSKMALTLIPSNALNEQKTMQELKNIQNF